MVRLHHTGYAQSRANSLSGCSGVSQPRLLPQSQLAGDLGGFLPQGTPRCCGLRVGRQESAPRGCLHTRVQLLLLIHSLFSTHVERVYQFEALLDIEKACLFPEPQRALTCRLPRLDLIVIDAVLLLLNGGPGRRGHDRADSRLVVLPLLVLGVLAGLQELGYFVVFMLGFLLDTLVECILVDCLERFNVEDLGMLPIPDGFVLHADLIHALNLRHCASLGEKHLQQLSACRSVLRCGAQAQIDQAPAEVADVGRVVDPILLDLSVDFTHVPSLVQGQPGQALVQDDPQGPDLGLLVVDIGMEGLGCHVGGRAHIVLQAGLGITGHFAVAEVDDFGHSLVQHYVGRFQIPMHDALLHQLLVAQQQTVQDLQRSLLAQIT